MAHLTKPEKYNIEDTNIALFGSDIEKRVHEHAGDTEHAWDNAGNSPGLQIWRIEKFTVVDWPKERYGSFYDGDSYIVLHTYKKDPESETLSYDLHFWLGSDTTQDEAGTAAYKTVELDDHLHGAPVEHREVQGYESPRFLSYFPRFVTLQGGVATGFHHVSSPPPLDLHRLYRIGVSHDSAHPTKSSLLVRQVQAEASSLVEGDVFVLDKGTDVMQFNTRSSVGKEKFRAAEFVQSLINERGGSYNSIVYDEGGSGAGVFLAEFNIEALPDRHHTAESSEVILSLFRITDDSGSVQFEHVSPPTFSSLSPKDAFLLDNTATATHPTIYVWIGKDASLKEQRFALKYAQIHLYEKKARGEGVRVGANIVKMREGYESEEFVQLLGGM